MGVPTSGPLKRALVQCLRSSSPLKAALTGGIHQSVARRRVRYPFVVYGLVSAPHVLDWGGPNNVGFHQIDALFDVSVFAVNPVDAENIDQLIADLLAGSESDTVMTGFLSTGQSILRADRVAELPTGPERDAEGRGIVRVGGTYRIVFGSPVSAPA